MSQLTEIIVKAGLVSPHSLTELRRWGFPVEDAPEATTTLHADFSVEVLCRAIDRVIQSEGYVLTRETDLEAVPQYLKTMRSAQLHIKDAEGVDVVIEVFVGFNSVGDYILPWRSESITEVLIDADTHLSIDNKDVFFRDARELFYGDFKAFVVCTPSMEVEHGKDS